MIDDAVPAWDGRDLVELMTLDAVGEGRFRSRLGDVNEHGRAYGGQVLGQALVAAAATVEAGRLPATMQYMFLQGTLHDRAIDFDVDRLQDGKRFSSRHVRGTQRGGRNVIDAQISFARPTDAPSHMAPPRPAGFGAEDPDSMPRLDQLPRAWAAEVQRQVGYVVEMRGPIDPRLPEVPDGLHLSLPEPRLRFWSRVAHPLPDDPCQQAAAFAYLSDWWLNYCSIGGHRRELGATRRLYVASLNHSIWLHRELRADDWLHFDIVSPSAAGGRSLSIAQVHDRAERLVATVTQECLMAPAY